MAIGILELTLYLPEVHSLKEKRHRVRPLVHFIQKHYLLSAAETGFQDKWQNALITCAMASGDPVEIENCFREVVISIEQRFPDIYIKNSSQEILV